jgi:hypothetical protein
MPDAGKRFMSLQVFDQDEYSPMVAYGAGRHTFTRDKIGTRYMAVAVRTFIDPTNPGDVNQVHALQDAIKVEQKDPGAFEPPKWDKSSQDKVRKALSALGETMPDFQRTFGRKDEVDPIRHLVGAAVGWGGNPEKDAFYLNVTPAENNGKTVYRLHVPEGVPVDGFWSISVYNKDGYFEPNARNAYSVNNVTAKKNADGSVDVQFGGCDGKATNCIPITSAWNCVVRLYRPRVEILNGSWKFPEPQPVN